MIKTKTGAASLYVVIFTTLLLGIITLGFVRIMLSESLQTSNADLSQSAFDSAMAGVEDAKLAILKYNECKSMDDYSSTPCKTAIDAMEDRENPSDTNCDVVRRALGRNADTTNETIIQPGTGDNNMDQAYTCVLIEQNAKDYLGQLNTNYHSKIIPIRTDDLDALNYVNLSWYSTINANETAVNIPGQSNVATDNKPTDDLTTSDNINTALFPQLHSNNPTAPPTLGVQLIQTDASFQLTQLSTNNGDNTNRGTLLLVPSTNASTSMAIGSSKDIGFPASSDKAMNTPIAIRCESTDTFYCKATIQIPKPYAGGNRNDESVFLRVFLPYGTPTTDFSVRLCKDAECANSLDFVGVQASIDSTGRANNLFRRIESRVELVDVYFPYPEYSATLKGTTADTTIKKNFYVTRDDWGNKNSAELPSTSAN